MFRNEEVGLGEVPSGLYGTTPLTSPPVELVIRYFSSRQTKQGLTISVDYEPLDNYSRVHLHLIYDVTGGKRRFTSLVSVEKPSLVTAHSFSVRYSRLGVKNEGLFLVSINGLDNIQRKLKPEENYANNVLPVTTLIRFSRFEARID